MAEQPTPPPADPLDPIRAWLAEIDAKLAVRTRVLLVLAAIAIGTAAASLFVALDSGDDSEGTAAEGLQQEVAELRSEVEGLRESIDAVSNAAVDAESAVGALEARVDALESESGAGTTGPTGATGETGSGGAAPGEAEGASGGDGGAAAGGAAAGGASQPGGAERAEAITEPPP